jgi:hypothetical protein
MDIIKYGDFKPLGKQKKKSQIILTHTSRNVENYLTSLRYRYSGMFDRIPNYVITKEGKTQYGWIDMKLSAERIGASSLKIRSAGSTKVFSDTDKENFGEVYPGTISTKVIRTELLPAYISKDGITVYLKADGSNLAAYNASKNKCTISRDIEKAYVVRPSSGIGGSGVNYIESELPGEVIGEISNISTGGSAANKDIQWGYTPKASAAPFGGSGDLDTYSGSSQSIVE